MLHKGVFSMQVIFLGIVRYLMFGYAASLQWRLCGYVALFIDVDHSMARAVNHCHSSEIYGINCQNLSEMGCLRFCLAWVFVAQV